MHYEKENIAEFETSVLIINGESLNFLEKYLTFVGFDGCVLDVHLRFDRIHWRTTHYGCEKCCDGCSMEITMEGKSVPFAVDRQIMGFWVVGCTDNGYVSMFRNIQILWCTARRMSDCMSDSHCL